MNFIEGYCCFSGNHLRVCIFWLVNMFNHVYEYKIPLSVVCILILFTITGIYFMWFNSYFCIYSLNGLPCTYHYFVFLYWIRKSITCWLMFMTAFLFSLNSEIADIFPIVVCLLIDNIFLWCPISNQSFLGDE